MKYLVNTLIVLSLILHRTYDTNASSKPRYKELNQANYTLLDLTIGECSRHDILSKLGPTLIISGENNTDNDYLCYVSDRDETLLLFGFKENRCTQFQMMSRKDQFYKWHFCAASPLVTEYLSTESGIRLGMRKDSLKRILGTPKKDLGEMLVFEYKLKKPMGKNKQKRGLQPFEDGSSISTRTASIFVETRFINSELSSIHMRIFKSKTPQKREKNYGD